MKRVAVGLSGGVDSAVAAAILVEQGYRVTAFYIEAYNEPGCRTDQDKRDALKVAMQLGIEFEVVDVREAYKREVTSYFYREYEAGRTPNPDMVCNREIKFGIFYDMVLSRGYDYVATGHYARVVEVPSLSSDKSIKFLQMAGDRKKDQSYFLAQVPNAKLKRVLFPLGEMTKIEVREKARALKLVVFDKPDSMGICFVGDVHVPTLLRTKMGVKPGDVVLSGQVVGQHQGIWTATVGERVGQAITLNTKQLKVMGVDTTNMPSWYVIGKSAQENQIIIGKREECLTMEFVAMKLHLVTDESVVTRMVAQNKLFVRVRNLGELQQVERLVRQAHNLWRVVTREPVFAPSPGQMAVLYGDLSDQQLPVGGGVVVGCGEIFTS